MLKLWQQGVDVESECCDVRSVMKKGVSGRVQFEAKCQETTMHYAILESVMAITRFQTEVSWHFRFLKN